MRLFVVFWVSLVVLSGCSFIVQDGETMKYYGMKDQAAHLLTQEVKDAQEKYYGPVPPPSSVAPQASVVPEASVEKSMEKSVKNPAENPVEKDEANPPDLK